MTGTQKLALEGRQVVRSFEHPPPGTMEWMWGWYWRCLPQVGRTPVTPGRFVPIKRASLARRLRASDEALNRAW